MHNPKLIEITTLHDEHECETCGGGYSTGYKVKIGGKDFRTFEPISACYDGVDFQIEFVYAQILQHLGYTVLLNEN